MNADGAARAFDGGAEFAESKFSVVAGADGFVDGGYAVSIETGEENRGFHLRAGGGRSVVNGAEVAAANFQRGAVAFAATDFGAHLAERLDDAAHGAAAERVVTGDDGSKGLAGQDAREHAHG